MANLPPLPSLDEQLPAYDAGDKSYEELIQPHTLVLSSRTIYQSIPFSPPLYQLSYGLEDLRDTTQSVTLSRLDYSVKTAGPLSEPSVRSRAKQIFTLVHPPWLMDSVFPFYAERSSRSGFGSVGIRDVGVLRSKRWLARKVVNKGGDLLARDHVFEGRVGKEKRTLEWRRTDGKGEPVEVVAVEEEGRLTFVTEMRREEVDVLVAIWCMRIWSLVIAAAPREPRWQHCEYSAVLHIKLTIAWLYGPILWFGMKPKVMVAN